MLIDTSRTSRMVTHCTKLKKEVDITVFGFILSGYNSATNMNV
jgi:hypothetical protein